MEENSPMNFPQHKSLDELVELFDSHDMGDYIDEMPEVEFEVDLKTKKYLVEIEGDLVEKLTELAKENQTTTKALINSWLKERITNSGKNRI